MVMTGLIMTLWLRLLNNGYTITAELPGKKLKKAGAAQTDDHRPERRHFIEIKRFIRFSRFHEFMDSLATIELPSGLNVSGDLLLIHFNPWILDTLRSKDYDVARKRNRFIDNLDEEIILRPGDRLMLPDSSDCLTIGQSLLSTRLILNIPEFRLRILRDKDTILSCPVRVGRNEQVFLEAIGRTVDLRTPVGTGMIIGVFRRPTSINLKTGQVYRQTRRDDGRITRMPAIPSMEPEINGQRNGKMIHAITNPITLGTAFSHGCVGVSEADMWTIYCSMPVGAAVEFRYELYSGSKQFKDIYGLRQ